MVGIIATLSDFMVYVIEQLGYFGVFIGMALESACIPLPSEIIMPFSGYVAWRGGLTLIGVTLAGTLGCLVGSLVAYTIGVYGGRPFLDRFGKYVLIRKREIDRAHEWFERHGEGTIFISRMLPIIRTFISLPAGIARMDIRKFSVYTVMGSLPWCFALAYVGVLLGPHWKDIEAAFVYLDVAVIVGLAGLLCYLIYHREWLVTHMQS
jgi:membrane protein DedA with SNARE-associated domain